jgi:hypothetical protein
MFFRTGQQLGENSGIGSRDVQASRISLESAILDRALEFALRLPASGRCGVLFALFGLRFEVRHLS